MFLTMKIFLVRHGDAIDHTPSHVDGERWLSAKGRRVSREVGERLRDENISPTRMISSPLVRAVQTAEVLAHSIGYREPIESTPLLVPEAHGFSELRALLTSAEDREKIFFVGHEPSIRTLTNYLLGKVVVEDFKKSTVVCLKREENEKFSFRFLLHPKTLEFLTDPARLLDA